MQATIAQLLKAADLINRVLHNLPSNTISFNLLEESKNTRRNSQYKIEVLNLFWYIAFKAVFKKDPEPFNGMGNERRLEENRGHWNSFKTKQYTYEMTNLLNRNIAMFINFGLNEYFKNCKKYEIRRLEIIDIQKQMNQIKGEKSLFIKKMDEKKEERAAYTIKQSKKHHLNQHKKISKKKPLMNKIDIIDGKLIEYSNTIIRLKEECNEPKVLSKFYLAWLMECDLEALFVIAGQRLKDNNYPPLQMRKFLETAITTICKKALPIHEKEVIAHTLKTLLKNEHAHVINQSLLSFSQKLKYSRCDIPEGNLMDNIVALDIKHFATRARNTQSIFCHSTPQLLEFTIVPYEIQNDHYCVIQYFDSVLKINWFFDLLSCSAISKDHLSQLSWDERLQLLGPLSIIRDIPRIKIKPLTKEQIQFNKYPGFWNYYIRTQGFGYGTLFFKSNNKAHKKTGKNNSNKRHKKIRPLDLEMREQPELAHHNQYPASSLYYGQSLVDQFWQQRQLENKMILEHYLNLLKSRFKTTHKKLKRVTLAQRQFSCKHTHRCTRSCGCFKLRTIYQRLRKTK